MAAWFFAQSPAEQRQLLFQMFPELAAASVEDRAAHLERLLADLPVEGHRPALAAALVQSTNIGSAVPERYQEFRRLVEVGAGYLLEHLPGARLRLLCRDQLLAAEDADAATRLGILARSIPTLGKLGQIMARRRDLPEAVRAMLRTLESVARPQPMAALHDHFHRELEAFGDRWEFFPELEVLGEASVNVTFRFGFAARDGTERGRGVAKMIRPDLAPFLADELALWDDLAGYLSQHPDRPDIAESTLRRLFQQARAAVAQEMNVSREQSTILLAHRLYGGHPWLHVPELLPWNTSSLTTMTEIPGRTFAVIQSDVPDTVLAARLFQGLLLEPLLSGPGDALFHGDPHGGNILVDSSRPGLAGIIDWAQVARVGQRERGLLMQMVLGCFCDHPERVARALGSLRVGKGGDSYPIGFVRQVRRSTWQAGSADPLAQALELMDTGVREGFEFPTALLVLRKAYLTLVNVLQGSVPDFRPEACSRAFLGQIMTSEWDKRLAFLCFPWLDHPHRFPSLLSNLDLLGTLHMEILRSSHEVLSAPLRHLG